MCRCDCRLERVRWAEGERGVRRAREPVVEVRRIGDGEGEGWEDGDWEGEGDGDGGRSVMVVG